MSDNLEPHYNFAVKSKLRGAWLVMLINAANAATPEECKFVCGQFRKLHEYFPCLECKGHFGQYLLRYPPEVRIEELHGLFNWVVDFMNTVCKRVGKPTYIPYILFKMFHEVGYGVCDKSCSEDEDSGENVTEKRPIKHVNPYSR